MTGIVKKASLNNVRMNQSTYVTLQ